VAEAVKKRRAAGANRTTDAAIAPSAFADFANPVDAAQSIVEQCYMLDGMPTLYNWQGDWHVWNGANYEPLPQADVREELYRIGPTCSRSPVRKTKVDHVIDALRAVTNLSHRKIPSAPAWIDPMPGDPDPREVIPTATGVLHIADSSLHAATPRLFVPYSLPFGFVAAAKPPEAWITFLASVWPDDPESVQCLQEWLGYLLTADTRFQKALLIVGPRRSGKGTIGRLIASLLGPSNVASPTLASLGHTFGLQSLIGKTAALLSDARLGARADIGAITENLLRITGEDAISIDRKFQTAYTARLVSRVIILANELPAFRDAASALPSRFVILRTTRSFYGAEDTALETKLNAELPGILTWALEGLRRLRSRGHFVQPQSSTDAVRLMEDLASPIGAYLRERCVLDSGATETIKDVYAAWREWCHEHGRDQPGTEQTFGRDLSAAAPGVRVIRPRIDGARVRCYSGLRLRTAADDGDGDELF